jgi:hypothetical protein
MKEYAVDTEKCDWKESRVKFEGTILTEADYDLVLHDKVSFKVLGPPEGVFRERRTLAVLIKDVYTDKDNIYNILKDINVTSDLRTIESGPVNKDLLNTKGLIEGEDYKMIDNNSYIRKSKNGEWQDVKRGNELYSGMIGNKRNRWTGENTITPWCKQNPDSWNKIKEIAAINDKVFSESLSEVYDFQKTWVNAYIKPEDRITYDGKTSIFTTLSINKYHKDYDVNGMGAHVDAGDLSGGRTTMAVFGEGDIEGAYLVFPRWGVAIKRERGDVVLADSNEIHGVTPILAGGSMITCIAYSDSRLKRK